MAAGSLELIEDLVRVLNAGELSELASQVVRIAHQNTGVERIRLYLAHPQSDRLKLEALAGDPGDAVDQEAELSSRSLLGRVALQECGPVLMSFPAAAATGGKPHQIPACLVPFRLPSAHVGVLVGDNLSGRAICEHEARLLQAIANFAAAGVGRATTGDTGMHSVAIVSHELRTPLTSICAFTEMLLDGDAGPLTPQQEQYVTNAYNGAWLLRKIVEDLLQLTRLVQGNAPIEPSSIDVRGFVLDTVSNFEPLAQAKEIDLAADLPASLPRLTTDKSRLRQALGNLLDNAIKYSPSGSVVTVVATADNGHVCIAVADQGPGIAPEHHHQVFDAFYRCYQDDESLRQKGSGLGLTVVQCIARLLGADVQLQSAPGKGSTFRLLLPVRQPIQDDSLARDEAFREPRQS